MGAYDRIEDETGQNRSVEEIKTQMMDGLKDLMDKHHQAKQYQNVVTALARKVETGEQIVSSPPI